MSAEPDVLSGQSCAVRCAGYLEQHLLDRAPCLEELRAALGKETEAASLQQLRTYLEGKGLYTLPCEWTGKAVVRWQGALHIIIHLVPAGESQGHFMVVEKNDAGITVVDWPGKQFFSNSYGGSRRWRDYVARREVTPVGLLVAKNPILLPSNGATLSAPFLLLSGCGIAILFLSLVLIFRRSQVGNTGTPCRQKTESSRESMLAEE